MWVQHWPVADIVLPYKNTQSVDVTNEMLAENYTPQKMFEMAEEFFFSLNMSSMTKTFWEKSVDVKLKDNREMVCNASAWDSIVDDDVRIKQCTRATMENFTKIDREIGYAEAPR